MRPAAAIAILAAMLAGPAWANAVPHMTDEQKLQAADLVIVGRITGTHFRELTMSFSWIDRPHDNAADPPKDMTFKTEYFDVGVARTLKGEAPPAISVSTEDYIPESSIADDTVDGDYTFYLKKLPDGTYQSVNGRDGVVPYAKPQ